MTFKEIVQIIANKYNVEVISFNMADAVKGVKKNIIFVIFNKMIDGHIKEVYIIANESKREIIKELNHILNNGFSKPFIKKTN